MLKSRLTAALVIALAFALSSCAWTLQAGESAPAFKLADQFDKTWELSSLKNSVVVVVAATRDSGRAMGPWVDNLKQKYGTKIQLLGLMDLHGIPGFARGFARSRIKKDTQDPLMLDFDGATAKAYLVSDKYPVAVVIDKTGVVRALAKSDYTADGFKPIAAAIDAALKVEPGLGAGPGPDSKK